MLNSVAGSLDTVTKTRLVLWDIDHTLVDFTGLGSAWYAAALAATTGTELVSYPDFGGRTERAISTDLLTAHGIEPTEELLQALWLALIAESERAVGHLPTSGRALPGAAEALTAFAGHDGVVQSLVTGNLPEISRHKLAAFGLDEHLDLDIGGYGTLSAHRPDLVPHAVALAAAKHGTEFAADVGRRHRRHPERRRSRAAPRRGRRSRWRPGTTPPRNCGPPARTPCCRIWPTPTPCGAPFSAETPKVIVLPTGMTLTPEEDSPKGNLALASDVRNGRARKTSGHD